MFIEFQSVRYKNFMSVGDYWIEVQLNRSPSTAVVGTNGAGKSTMVESIMYGLYGKPYRKDLVLAGLINSVNKKKMEVELCFRVGSDNFKVCRGEKPKKFEIYKNDELVESRASAKQYQEYLDKVIGFDAKLIAQTAILNKERFVPFLSLSAGDRRSVVESFIGIEVFQVMNLECKEKQDQLKSSISETSRKLSDYKKDMDHAKSTIDMINSRGQGDIDSKRKELDTVNLEIDELVKRAKELKEQYDSFDSDIDTKIIELDSERQKIESSLSTLRSDVSHAMKSKAFFDQSSCGTCGQDIDKEFANEKKAAIDSELEEMKAKGIDGSNKSKELSEQIVRLKELLQERNSINTKINETKTEYRVLKARQDSLKSDIEKLESDNDTSSYVEQLDKLTKEYDELGSVYESMLQDQEDYNFIRNSLKDDGIKARIIANYIPLINEKINEYMEEMEFFVGVELTETFDISFTAPNRKDFTYANLSAGQKTRLDLAIILALMDICRVRGTVETNLLFMDEVLEAVDYEGIQVILNLIKSKLSDRNLFLITQRRNEVVDMVHSEIEFQLKDGFTQMI